MEGQFFVATDILNPVKFCDFIRSFQIPIPRLSFSSHKISL